MTPAQKRSTDQTVLVLDANQRSALAVTRSLGRHSNIHVLTADDTPSSLAGSSRYSKLYLQHPSAATAPVEFCQWLAATVKAKEVAIVFPTTEVTSQLLLMHPGLLGKCQLPFADIQTVMQLANKWRLVSVAEKLGIPYPHSRLVSSLAEADLPDHLPEPIVIKPCLSRIWLGDRWLNSAVHVAHSAAELQSLVASKPYLSNHPFMLQEFIPGHGAGIFALYDRGKPAAFFAHRRLREKPPRGGVSVLSESVEPDPSMLRIARQLLDAVGWHGVAMVEFRVTPEGKPYLMEVNTRFWGSLQLAIDAGVDFPHLLYQITNGNAPPESRPYRIGQRLRWLLGDLDSLYLSLRDPELTLKSKGRRLLDFALPHRRPIRHEVNRLHDLGPAWHELKRYLASLNA